MDAGESLSAHNIASLISIRCGRRNSLKRIARLIKRSRADGRAIASLDDVESSVESLCASAPRRLDGVRLDKFKSLLRELRVAHPTGDVQFTSWGLDSDDEAPASAGAAPVALARRKADAAHLSSGRASEAYMVADDEPGASAPSGDDAINPFRAVLQ